jgi:hypothetical protein
MKGAFIFHFNAALHFIKPIRQLVKGIRFPHVAGLVCSQIYFSIIKTDGMKQVKSAMLLALAAFCVTLFSFRIAGGDHFEVWLNNKKIIEQAVYKNEAVKSLQLDQLHNNDQLRIYYSHCGITGSGRKVSIRDADNRVLKTWSFGDASGKSFMICPAKEILALHPSGKNLSLYYASRELPEGRLLASIVDNGSRTAGR